jgi:hypothetical protein
MKLSEHFTLEEATFSETAIRNRLTNIPSDTVIQTMKQAATKMEVVRTVLGNLPIVVTSWYRSKQVNRLVGSSDTSAHPQGFAIDFKCPKFGSPLDIIKALVDAGVKFDQVIQEGGEYGWVHISFDPRMRGQVLTAIFRKGQKTTYKVGL